MIGNSNFGFSSGGVSGGVPIGGGGTPNFIAKFTPTGIVINNSLLFDNGVTIGLGTITPNASALLDITSTTQGFLTPRMTQTERNAISTPATGLFIYNTTSSHFNFWDGAAWLVIESSTLTSDTLGQVLAAGNTTGGLPIIMTSGDTINFSVGSGGILNSLSTSVNQTWNLPDASGTIALLSNIPAPAPITINVIPKGTGTSITDGTWQFSGNDIIPTTTGSNIGDATHRIGTIFMASTFDYASDLNWVNGVNTHMTFTTTGRLGIGTILPLTNLNVAADNGTAIIASIRYSNDTSAAGFVGAKARGTQALPLPVLTGDHLCTVGSVGYTSAGVFSSLSYTGKTLLYAAENFTATALGTNFGIFTTAKTTTIILERVTVTSEGLVGIGIITPITARLQVVGVDATVSNYGLKIQDNTTADLFVVRNDGNVYANGSGHITSNTAFGLNAFISNTTGTAIDNTAYGLNALQNLTGIAGFGGIANVALGGHALQNLINGGYSVAVGFCALQASQHDGFNTAVGTEAGVQLNGGNYNVYIGHQAGNTSLINSNQTLIGANATSLFDSTIVIGYHANATAPNQVIIGSDNAPANNYYFGSGVETGSVGFTGIHAITFQPSSVINTFTDGDALDWYFNGAKSTGTGIGGNIIFQTAPSGVSGTTQNSLIEAMRIAQSGNVGIGIAVPLARLHNFGIDATTKINQRLEPVVGVTQDTSGDSTTTSGAVTSIAQTLAIPTDTVQYIVSTITYRKPIPNAGAGATGQGTTIKISVSVQNIGGVLTLDTIQNDYTGTVNAIAGVSATFLISGGTNVIVQVTGAVFDFITYNVISVVNTIS